MVFDALDDICKDLWIVLSTEASFARVRDMLVQGRYLAPPIPLGKSVVKHTAHLIGYAQLSFVITTALSGKFGSWWVLNYPEFFTDPFQDS